VREEISRHRWAVLDTNRVALTQVTFEYFFVGSYLNGSKRTGIHTGKTLDAVLIVNEHHPGLFIEVHGIGNRAGLFARRIRAVSADYRKGRVVFLGPDNLYPHQGRVNHPRLPQRTHQLTNTTPGAELIERQKNLPLLHKSPYALLVWLSIIHPCFYTPNGDAPLYSRRNILIISVIELCGLT